MGLFCPEGCRETGWLVVWKVFCVYKIFNLKFHRNHRSIVVRLLQVLVVHIILNGNQDLPSSGFIVCPVPPSSGLSCVKFRRHPDILCQVPPPSSGYFISSSPAVIRMFHVKFRRRKDNSFQVPPPSSG